MKLNQKKWFIGISIIFGTVILISTMSLSQNTVYFYKPEEALQQSARLSQKVIKVGGIVKPGSVSWEPESVKLTFMLSNEKKDIDIEVTHFGSPPDLFKEGQGVIAEGKLSSDGLTMRARTLMVKHSEEYIAPGEDTQEKYLLENAILEAP